MFIIKILCFSFRECKTGILTTPSKTTAKTRSEKHFGNYLMTCKVLLLSKSKQSTFKLWLKMRCKQVCQTYFYVKCVFRSQSNSSIEQHREGTLFQLQKKITFLRPKAFAFFKHFKGLFNVLYVSLSFMEDRGSLSSGQFT